MLSEERVKLMTKMAFFEQEESKNYMIVAKYTRRDYVARQLIMGFFMCTAVYLIVAGMIFFVLIDRVITNINSLVTVLFILAFLISYAVTIYFYLVKLKATANMRYDMGKKKLALVKQDMKKLEELYKKEEEQMAPSVTPEVL